MKTYFQHKTVWITGASSGIGEALAYQLAKYQTRLILSARRTDELERVAIHCRKLGSEAFVYPIDLADASTVAQVAQDVLQNLGPIDILINNGGITQRSLAAETPVDIDRKIMEINYFSGLILTKALLPGMIQRGYGHIVAISSVTGTFGFPERSAYAASKHAILGFYETLWAELSGKGVHVTMACPGRVQTNISYNAITASGEPYNIMDHGKNEGFSAEECARKILNAVANKKPLVYIAGKEMIMVYLKRYIPRLFYKLVTRVKLNTLGRVKYL